MAPHTPCALYSPAPALTLPHGTRLSPHPRFADTTVTPWTAWTTDDGTLAGYVTQYEKGFTFTTIRLAGHMVPQVRAGDAR